VADPSGNPDVAPPRFACDGELELPLDPVAPHLREGLAALCLPELDVETGASRDPLPGVRQ